MKKWSDMSGSSKMATSVAGTAFAGKAIMALLGSSSKEGLLSGILGDVLGTSKSSKGNGKRGKGMNMSGSNGKGKGSNKSSNDSKDNESLFSSFKEKILNNKHSLPSFQNVLETKHTLPGRIRLLSKVLVNNDELKGLFLSQMKRIDGIKQVTISTITGSILINYDESKLQPMLIFSICAKLLGVEEILSTKKNSKLQSNITDFNDAINTSLYEKTNGLLDFKTLVPLILLSLGLKKIFIDKTTLSANPYSLLFWAYKGLGLGGEK